ncbi:unnamed protein product, partial [Porites lobata]
TANRNCAELYKAGKTISGVYTIDPDGEGAFDVFCDQKTTGGGWTVFQKRLDGSVYFYRSWDDYKNGFGDLNGEFWLGLDKIYRLTEKKHNRLRVDLEDFTFSTAYAEYDIFEVTNETTKYKLSLGMYSGTAGDSLSEHRGHPFTTKDRDHDENAKFNCAAYFKGAWWYTNCHASNLNGLYYNGSHAHKGQVTTRRSKSYKSFYFSQEAKGIKIHRKLMTSILKTFHHFNRSSADNKHSIRSYDLWSHALVTSACCHEIFVAVLLTYRGRWYQPGCHYLRVNQFSENSSRTPSKKSKGTNFKSDLLKINKVIAPKRNFTDICPPPTSLNCRCDFKRRTEVMEQPCVRRKICKPAVEGLSDCTYFISDIQELGEHPGHCYTRSPSSNPNSPRGSSIPDLWRECHTTRRKEDYCENGWSSWGPWGPCSVRCGGGNQNRVRDCTNSPPSKGENACLGLSMESQACNPQNCSRNGVYTIDPDGEGAFNVFCDQKTAGGGWTVFQKRLDGSVDFYRNWDDYKNGFGNLNSEFWLGLDKIYRLTEKKRNRLRVDLEDFTSSNAYAEYSWFAISNETTKYKLSLGRCSGTAGDSLLWHRGYPFSTIDRDHDGAVKTNCAVVYNGAWWYNSCHDSNLNGLYYNGSHPHKGQGIIWYTWKGIQYSVKRAEMKIRPADF